MKRKKKTPPVKKQETKTPQTKEHSRIVETAPVKTMADFSKEQIHKATEYVERHVARGNTDIESIRRGARPVNGYTLYDMDLVTLIAKSMPVEQMNALQDAFKRKREEERASRPKGMRSLNTLVPGNHFQIVGLPIQGELLELSESSAKVRLGSSVERISVMTEVIPIDSLTTGNTAVKKEEESEVSSPPAKGSKGNKNNEESLEVRSSSKSNILGISASAVVRWMASNDWMEEEIQKVIKSFGVELNPTTYQIQVKAGRMGGTPTRKIPELTKEQRKEIRKRLLSDD